MIKAAIDKILGLSQPNVIDRNGEMYVDKSMTAIRPPEVKLASPLQVNTLSSIIDYIKQDTDRRVRLNDEGRFVIHIKDYNKVNLYRELNVDKNRELLLTAQVDNCNFNFGRFMPTEDFIINLQSNFVPSNNIDSLISLAGNIVDEQSVTTKDDGVTQQVTAKTGVSLVKRVEVPNPVVLQPYRTFTEISQPESSLVFRLRKSREEVAAALFEADGEAWKREAIFNIRDYFRTEIPDGCKFKVIVLA